MLYRTRLLLPTSASTASTLISSDPTLASVATPLREEWERDLGPGWLLLPLYPAGFSWKYLWLQVPPQPLAPLTRRVLRLGELGGLVIDVIQEDPHFLQGQVLAEVPELGSCCPLAPGRSPVPLAGCFDDDGVVRLLLPVQVPQDLQLPFSAQLEVALLVPSWVQKGIPSQSSLGLALPKCHLAR